MNLANGTLPPAKSRTPCSGLDSLILAATADMRHFTLCPTSISEAKTMTSNDNGGRRVLRTWDDSFEALVAYAEVHGNTTVPVRYKEDTALANWVRYQQRNALSHERRQKLESIGFKFGGRNDRQWNNKFQRFQEHVLRHGAQAVLRDIELSQWVSTQRSLFKKNLMRQDRRAKLEGVGFFWQANNSNTVSSGNNKSKTSFGCKTGGSNANTKSAQRREDQWLTNFKKLKAFYREHNHFLVPCHFEQDEALGIWVSNQRSMHNRGLMPRNRERLLSDIGFVWRVDAKQARAELYQKQWDQQFELLLQYKRANGHVEVPPNFASGELGTWVSVQKETGRKGSLDAKRAERLLSAGLTWGEERDTCWTRSFIKLKELKESLADKMPDTTVFGDDIALQDAKLGNWLKLQCVNRNHKSLSLKRRYLLEQIDLQWKGVGTSSTDEPHLIPDAMVVSLEPSENLKRHASCIGMPNRPFKKSRL